MAEMVRGGYGERTRSARVFHARGSSTLFRRTWFRARRLGAALAVALPAGLRAFSAQADNATVVTVSVTGKITNDNTAGHVNAKFIGQMYTLTTSYSAAILTQNVCPPDSYYIACSTTTNNPSAATTTLSISGAPTITSTSALSSSFIITMIPYSGSVLEGMNTGTAGDFSLKSGGVDGGIIGMDIFTPIFDPNAGFFQKVSYTLKPSEVDQTGFNGLWPAGFSPNPNNTFAFYGNVQTLTVDEQLPRPAIFANGVNITGTTAAHPVIAVVGRPIDLSTEPAPYPGQTQSWTGIPVDAILGSFDGFDNCPPPDDTPNERSIDTPTVDGGCTGTLTKRTTSDFMTSAPPRFYWIVPGTYSITYQYTVNGESASSPAAIQVNSAPSVTADDVTVQYGTPRADWIYTDIDLYMGFGNPFTDDLGITFTIRQNPGHGQFKWI